PTFGTLEVCIDESCESVDNYSEYWLRRQTELFDDLGSGVHTVTIRSTSGSYDIDAIQVNDTSVIGEGLHEQTSSDLVFTGNWVEQTHPQYSGGSQLITWDKSAGLWFRFEGDTLTLIRTTGPTYGTLGVCIDTVCEDVDDSSAEWLKRQPVTFPDLGAGIHEVQIYSVAGNHSLDAVQVDNTSVIGEGLHEETSGDLVFFGNWVEQTHPQYSGGTQIVTWDRWARLWFRFEGDTLTLLRTTGPTYGTLEVCIDETCENVDDSSVDWLKRQAVTFGGLGTGVHEVQIRNVEGNHGIDAIQVDNASILPEGQYEETNGNLVYTGDWQVRSGSGFSGGALLVSWDTSAMVWFRFESDTLTLLRRTGPDLGTVEVCIDETCEIVDNYSTTWLKQVPVVFDELGEGEHEFVMRIMTNSNDIDAIEVGAGVGGAEVSGQIVDEPTEEPTATDELTETPEPTDEPEATETPEPTESPTPTATDEPDPTATEEPTATDEPDPTATTEEPTVTETPEPTEESDPTATETPEPTDEPEETEEPTESPTPTEETADEATVEETATPEPD
ncbi:MAG: hypothetical protein JXJ17_12120, partial [Anaerolineae bacterium]|nr:hypothetical protein [Anaerolineae bacterium]